MCAVALIAVCLCLQVASPAVSAKTRRATIDLKALPLWRALPTRAFIDLGGETTGRSTWKAFAFRSPQSQNPRQICLEMVFARERHPGFLSVERASPECGEVGPGIESPVAAEAGRQDPASTVVLVVTGTNAVNAKLVLSEGTVRRGKFRLVQGSRAAKARLKPFRYALLVPHPAVCVDQIIGEGIGGAKEFETAKGRCAEVPS